MNTEALIAIVEDIAKRSKIKVYIVGGYLRDTLLNKVNISDVDFVVYGDAKKTAKQFAKKVNGSFVELSEAFKIYRVVCKDGGICDFSKGRGKKIEDDLVKRDFTVNALAKDASKNVLIDVCGGLKDIKNGVIRETAGKKVLKDDPIRLLRAVRFSAALNFKLHSKTVEHIKELSVLISKPAKERVRDELFKIFETTDSVAYIILLDKLKLFDKIFPIVKDMKGVSQPGFHHLDVFGHSIESLRRLEEIYKTLDFSLSEEIKRLIREKINGRTGQTDRKSFLKLIALLHDSGKPKTKSKDKKGTHFYNHELVGAENFKKIGRQLKLSNEEIDNGMTVIKCHLRTGYLSGLKKISKKAVYKFLRDTGELAVEVLLLSWADRLSARGVKVDKKTLSIHKKVIENLFKAYYNSLSEKKVTPLLNGHELMKEFKLSPSPLIGKLLEKVKEARGTGKIKTKEEAFKYIAKYA